MAWNVQAAWGQELAIFPHAALVLLGRARRQSVHMLVEVHIDHRANSPEHGIDDMVRFQEHHGGHLSSHFVSLSAFGDDSAGLAG